MCVCPWWEYSFSLTTNRTMELGVAAALPLSEYWIQDDIFSSNIFIMYYSYSTVYFLPSLTLHVKSPMPRTACVLKGSAGAHGCWDRPMWVPIKSKLFLSHKPLTRTREHGNRFMTAVSLQNLYSALHGEEQLPLLNSFWQQKDWTCDSCLDKCLDHSA